MQPGPGPVATVHRITIACALVATVCFALWELVQYAQGGAAGHAVGLALATAAAAGIGLYLRSLRGLAAKLTPRPPSS